MAIKFPNWDVLKEVNDFESFMVVLAIGCLTFVVLADIGRQVKSKQVKLHHFFEVAETVFLALMVVAEVFQFVYGKHKEELEEARYQDAAGRLAALDAPRKFTVDQKAHLLKFLRRAFGQPVLIISTSNDIEASQYAVDFGDLLKSAGWAVNMERSDKPLRDGMTIIIPSKGGGIGIAAIGEGFQQVGIGSNMIYDETGKIQNRIKILIGHR